MAGTFIIAEAGVNHNGSLDLAKRLVDAAATARADAVKFQTFVADRLVTADADMAAYQVENMGGGDSQRSMLRRLELSQADFAELKEHCSRKGITFLSTPFDEGSAEFLLRGLDVELIKIPSGELTNHPLLEVVARAGRPVILSTGMCDTDDIDAALQVMRGLAPGLPITLLHCTSNYPCPFEEVNLRAMRTMADRYGLPVGYSDHTMGIEVPVAAVALGATVIEKHFTLDRALPGPDHRCSLEPTELAQMVEAIRNVERSLGDGVKRPTASEIEIRGLIRKSLVAARDLPAGHRISPSDVVAKRPAGGIAPSLKAGLVGLVLCVPKSADELMRWEDVGVDGGRQP